MKWGEEKLLPYLSDVPKTTTEYARILFPDVKTITQEYRSQTHRMLRSLEKRGLVESRVIRTETLRPHRYWVKAGCTAKLDELEEYVSPNILSAVTDEWQSTSAIFAGVYGRNPSGNERDRANRTLKRACDRQAIEHTTGQHGRNEWRLPA